MLRLNLKPLCVNGKTFAHVKFDEENAAVDLAAKMNEKLANSEKLKIKGTEISFRVLKGKEETDYLNRAIKFYYLPQKSD
jgi:hypothetical protein